MALTLLEFPTVAYDVDHDLSSSASFEYFAARRFQFGTQVIQNVGPLGWLHYGEVYAGYLHNARLVLKGVVRLGLVALVLLACRRLPTRFSRVAWLMAFFVILPIGVPSIPGDVLGTYEVWAYLGVYLAWLVARDAPWMRAAPAVFYLAALALMKHTLLALAAFSLVVGAAHRRRTGTAAVLPLATFIGASTLLWTLAGQGLSGLPNYAIGATRFTAGYNEALALPAATISAGFGAAVLSGLAILIALRAALRSQSAAKSLVDAAFLFVIWKHGFVRADLAHVAIFFTAGVFFALLFGLAGDEAQSPSSELRGRSTLGLRTVLAVGVSGVCVLALFASIPEADYRPGRLIGLWGHNASWLVTPVRKTEQLEAQLRENRRLYALPQVRERVTQEPIDFFGYEPGWLLLNDLNYTPRPMPITFAAANERLLRLNAAFYRNEARAPRFVLAKLGTIDGRLVTEDDGLALGALLDNYHPVLLQSDLALLERNPTGWTRPREARKLLLERLVGPGEELSLRELPNGWLWMEAEVRPSLLGRLCALALRPPTLRIAVEFEGDAPQQIRRYVASMGATGFLISPFLESSTDLFEAYAAAPGSSPKLPVVRAIRFLVEPGDLRYIDPRIATRVYAGPRPRGRVTSPSPVGPGVQRSGSGRAPFEMRP